MSEATDHSQQDYSDRSEYNRRQNEIEAERKALALRLEAYITIKPGHPAETAFHYKMVAQIMHDLDRLRYVSGFDEVYWHADLIGGSDIPRAMASAYHLCVLTDIPVNFKANGIFISVRPEIKG